MPTEIKTFKSIDELKQYMEELHSGSAFYPEKVLEHLKQILSMELKKRGFFVKTSLNWSDLGKELCFVLNSEEFNTTPVIFESICIASFCGSIYGCERERVVEFWLPVHARWKHFDIGENGTSIFALKGHISLTCVKNIRIL